MSEREPDEQDSTTDEQEHDDVVEELEEDPSLAGNSPDEYEELRGG